MPIFAYRCDSCGFEKDVLQKRSDPPLDTCPTCSRETFRKRLSAPAFQLKGSGWYVTDFRDNGKAKAKPGESGDAAGADAKAPADAKDLGGCGRRRGEIRGAGIVRAGCGPGSGQPHERLPGPARLRGLEGRPEGRP